jgi:hypothetical protein
MRKSRRGCISRPRRLRHRNRGRVFRIRHRTGALFQVDLGRERLAHMEEVFPGDPGDVDTGAGFEVNCVAFLIGRFLELDPQKQSGWAGDHGKCHFGNYFAVLIAPGLPLLAPKYPFPACAGTPPRVGAILDPWVADRANTAAENPLAAGLSRIRPAPDGSAGARGRDRRRARISRKTTSGRNSAQRRSPDSLSTTSTWQVSSNSAARYWAAKGSSSIMTARIRIHMRTDLSETPVRGDPR